ncbi:complex I subunit 1 family protein [Actinomadura fulvescens]|uniref:NADH-quinone oxidoreductase subunit H n=1 Tax=Actinomadura fulvescens TaxID=46160 RepID=A0ABN3PEC8_9ACTN
MDEPTPVWAVVALPLVLAALTYAAAATDAAFRTVAGARGGPVRSAADPLRETVRLLVQRRRVTTAPDRLLTRIGVISLPVAALLAAVVIPLGGTAVARLPVGVVWFNAMEVVAWASLWLTGWGVNSAFPLVGGYRFIAQGLAYELPHMFALITAALAAGSLDLSEVAAAQDGVWFAVWMPVAFAVYLLSALAMAFWGPMGHPVAEDLAGGVPLELSGPDRLIFFAGRYALLAVVAAAAVPLFLGGGAGPLLPAWAWALVKTCAVLVLLVWTRHRLPVVRMDRFMEVAWIVLIPATLVQLLVVAIVVVD